MVWVAISNRGMSKPLFRPSKLLSIISMTIKLSVKTRVKSCEVNRYLVGVVVVVEIAVNEISH